MAPRGGGDGDVGWAAAGLQAYQLEEQDLEEQDLEDQDEVDNPEGVLGAAHAAPLTQWDQLAPLMPLAALKQLVAADVGAAWNQRTTAAVLAVELVGFTEVCPRGMSSSLASPRPRV
jgi:hypothetical protein